MLLASSSPRRYELLQQLEVAYRVAPADIDESVNSGENPQDYVRRMARGKALAGFSQTAGDLPVLGADTIVVLQGEILGKPSTKAHARDMLQRLSGQTHHVYSAVALAINKDNIQDRLNITTVKFGKLSRTWIARYCLGSEPMDKAGAYAVQGAAGQFIECINGSYTGVMGLPLYDTARLLRQAGLLM